jgi:hypothetical protein
MFGSNGGGNPPDPKTFGDPNTGSFFTRNPTEDPQYPAGSFYESMGVKGYGHNTNIYDPNGQLLHQTDPGAVQQAMRDYILDRWKERGR